MAMLFYDISQGFMEAIHRLHYEYPKLGITVGNVGLGEDPADALVKLEGNLGSRVCKVDRDASLTGAYALLQPFADVVATKREDYITEEQPKTVTDHFACSTKYGDVAIRINHPEGAPLPEEAKAFLQRFL